MKRLESEPITALEVALLFYEELMRRPRWFNRKFYDDLKRYPKALQKTEEEKSRFLKKSSFPQLFYPLMTRQFFCDFHEKSEDFCVS